ncbi:FkbM family methyltransferase [Litoricolaceae bacterium]|nr:FkbM family methyltransferase [Litorivicinaceae bacterium]
MQRPNIFINPSDHMGFEFLVDGSWDQFLTDSIKMVSTEVGSSLFIDIGANIGLISVQVAGSFNKLIALEPNPIAFGVLQANALTHIAKSKLSLRNYGLGSQSELAQLNIPEKNLGGAFVESSDNKLTTEELAKKEGGRIDIIKAFDISIQSAADFFQSIKPQSKHIQSRIVIKVDVEGMEGPIIEALIDSDLWRSEEVICFIETWSHTLKTKLLRDLSGRILLQPKNQMKWLDPREVSNVENATELCIWNANLPKRDVLKLCE